VAPSWKPSWIAGRGPVATVLVQEGTLHVSEPFVCGGHYGRVRAMVDDKGQKVETAGRRHPWRLSACRAYPTRGSSFVAVADEATARQVAEHRRGKQRETDLVKTAKSLAGRPVHADPGRRTSKSCAS